jgi:hypothetical protein
MNATSLTVLVLVIFNQRVVAKPQQHAPTVETCRLDAARWCGAQKVNWRQFGVPRMMSERLAVAKGGNEPKLGKEKRPDSRSGRHNSSQRW